MVVVQEEPEQDKYDDSDSKCVPTIPLWYNNFLFWEQLVNGFLPHVAYKEVA